MRWPVWYERNKWRWEWHRHFAWRVVELNSKERAWLETVERKVKFSDEWGIVYEYRRLE